MKKRTMKIALLFFSLFLINILVLKLLSIIGFNMVITENAYLIPPLFSTVILLIVEKIRTGYHKKYSWYHRIEEVLLQKYVKDFKGSSSIIILGVTYVGAKATAILAGVAGWGRLGRI